MFSVYTKIESPATQTPQILNKIFKQIYQKLISITVEKEVP